MLLMCLQRAHVGISKFCQLFIHLLHSQQCAFTNLRFRVRYFTYCHRLTAASSPLQWFLKVHQVSQNQDRTHSFSSLLSLTSSIPLQLSGFGLYLLDLSHYHRSFFRHLTSLNALDLILTSLFVSTCLILAWGFRSLAALKLWESTTLF